MTTHAALIALSLLLSSALAAPPDLYAQRRAAMQAIYVYLSTHYSQCCGLPNSEVKTDIVAFPAGRADRVYVMSAFLAYAYFIQGGVAHRVWCGASPQPGQHASALEGNAARALGFAYRTASGVFPVERGSMDVFVGFAGSITTQQLNPAGKTVCSKTRGPSCPEQFNLRLAQDFARFDTCP